MEHFDFPFSHFVDDRFIDAETVTQINREWPSRWLQEDGRFNLKWSQPRLPPAAQAVADSIDVGYIGELLGIDGLFADPDLYGAGLHCVPYGGFLNMHVDFNQHPNGWHRRANLLIYLNEDWDESWGGHLQLGEGMEKSIAPLAGRAVLFETTEESWHGHPIKLKCPPSRHRRSLALYYYTEESPQEGHSTIYTKDGPCE